MANQVDIGNWAFSGGDGLESARRMSEADGLYRAEIQAHDEQQVFLQILKQRFAELKMCDDRRAGEGVGRRGVSEAFGVVVARIENVNFAILG